MPVILRVKLSGLALLLVTATAFAVPSSISYQGYLTDASGAPVDGVRDMSLHLYTVETGGVPIYSQSESVTFTGGLFSVTLGPLPPGIANTPLFLGVEVDADSEMTPRRALLSTAYALKSDDAQSVQGLLPVDLQGAQGPPGAPGPEGPEGPPGPPDPGVAQAILELQPRICELYGRTGSLPAEICGGCFDDSDCFQPPPGECQVTAALCLDAGTPDAVCQVDFLNKPDHTPCSIGGCIDGVCDVGGQLVDNGDGTVTDMVSGLTWEKKDNSGGIHDVDNTYTLDTQCDNLPLTCLPWTGTAYTVFLDTLNDVAGGGTNCFAGHCDWRLPSTFVNGSGMAELETLVLPTCPAGPCIAPEYGPTAPAPYWTGLAVPPDAGAVGLNAYTIDFADGNVSFAFTQNERRIRAVRGP